jgi:ceramide glucosyltransferase
MHAFQDALLGLGLFGLATSTVYGGLVARACLRFRRAECHACGAWGTCGVSDGVQPPVSILKPLHGAEPNLDSHLESFYNQEYPQYELLFCARSADDPGLKIARAVAARHPNIESRFFTSGEPKFANAKVASLETMYRAARHDILIVSDSDVHVERNYLREVVAPFRAAKVGAVTCLYRGVVAGHGNSIWAYLEGVGMSIEMPAGVLVARMLEGMQFLLGPTMAVRRRCVEEIGGFQSLGQYCSDDFLLGNWIAAHGHEVVLSQHVVDHVILNTGFLASVKHQVRWMKSTRCSRPKGHLGTSLTFAMPFALLASLALLWMGHGELAAMALGWGLLSRILLAGVVGGLVVNERDLLRTMLLHPLRDLMGFGYWLASYSSNRILWRGQEYELLQDGMMRAVGTAGGRDANGVSGSDKPRNKEQEPALTL